MKKGASLRPHKCMGGPLRLSKNPYSLWQYFFKIKSNIFDFQLIYHPGFIIAGARRGRYNKNSEGVFTYKVIDKGWVDYDCYFIYLI